ncbi:techylectin-5A [Trichonephila clavipes]|nr:techylectin-5A [Trichonephila clavipes]
MYNNGDPNGISQHTMQFLVILTLRISPIDHLGFGEVAMTMLLLSAAIMLLISAELASAAKLGKSSELSSRLSFTEDSNAEPPKCPKHFKPMDCEEVMENGNSKSGVYTIWPRSRVGSCPSIQVYCDMETDGGGWTVIQRRGNFGNAQNYFDKTWIDYKTGFGNVKREFWIGNDIIFAITNQGQYSARFEVTNREGKSAFAVYEKFYIEEESAKYKLHIEDYSGTAGDAISSHNEWEFYTKDQPNRRDEAKKDDITHTGGWWKNVFPTTSLNALNNHGDPHANPQQGMCWNPFGGFTGGHTKSHGGPLVDRDRFNTHLCSTLFTNIYAD